MAAGGRGNLAPARQIDWRTHSDRSAHCTQPVVGAGTAKRVRAVCPATTLAQPRWCHRQQHATAAPCWPRPTVVAMSTGVDDGGDAASMRGQRHHHPLRGTVRPRLGYLVVIGRVLLPSIVPVSPAVHWHWRQQPRRLHRPPGHRRPVVGEAQGGAGASSRRLRAGRLQSQCNEACCSVRSRSATGRSLQCDAIPAPQRTRADDTTNSYGGGPAHTSQVPGR
jgi:hypothetical protein